MAMRVFSFMVGVVNGVLFVDIVVPAVWVGYDRLGQPGLSEFAAGGVLACRGSCSVSTGGLERTLRLWLFLGLSFVSVFALCCVCVRARVLYILLPVHGTNPFDKTATKTMTSKKVVSAVYGQRERSAIRAGSCYPPWRATPRIATRTPSQPL